MRQLRQRSCPKRRRIVASFVIVLAAACFILRSTTFSVWLLAVGDRVSVDLFTPTRFFRSNQTAFESVHIFKESRSIFWTNTSKYLSGMKPGTVIRIDSVLEKDESLTTVYALQWNIFIDASPDVLTAYFQSNRDSNNRRNLWVFGHILWKLKDAEQATGLLLLLLEFAADIDDDRMKKEIAGSLIRLYMDGAGRFRGNAADMPKLCVIEHLLRHDNHDIVGAGLWMLFAQYKFWPVVDPAISLPFVRQMLDRTAAEAMAAGDEKVALASAALLFALSPESAENYKHLFDYDEPIPSDDIITSPSIYSAVGIDIIYDNGFVIRAKEAQ